MDQLLGSTLKVKSPNLSVQPSGLSYFPQGVQQQSGQKIVFSFFLHSKIKSSNFLFVQHTHTHHTHTHIRIKAHILQDLVCIVHAQESKILKQKGREVTWQSHRTLGSLPSLSFQNSAPTESSSCHFLAFKPVRRRIPQKESLGGDCLR